MREFPLGGLPAIDNVVDQAIAGENVVITRDGHKEAVVVSWANWQRLSQVPSFGHLLASSPLDENDIPSRDRSTSRDAGLWAIFDTNVISSLGPAQAMCDSGDGS